MAKTKRYTNFREFYENEDQPRSKLFSEPKRNANQNLNRYKHMDPKDLENEEDFDDNDIDTKNM